MYKMAWISTRWLEQSSTKNVFTQLFALAYMDQDVFSHWCHTFGLVGCQQIEIVELRSSRALSREELSKGQFLLVAINPPAIINSHWTRSYLHKCRQAYHHQHRHHHCYSHDRHHHQQLPPLCTIVKHHCQYCEICPPQVSALIPRTLKKNLLQNLGG